MSEFADLFARNGLSIDRLRALVEVADAGGIARAAPGSPTRQSQLSRQLGELEDFFGVALTLRKGQRLALTGEGLSLVEHVRWFLHGIAGVRELAGTRRSVPLSIGAGDAVVHFQVVPALAVVSRARPEATFSVTALPNDAILARLRDGELDVGVVRARRVPRPFVATRIGTWDCALYVPRKLLGKRATVESVLREVPLALQSSEPAFVAEVVAAAARRGVTLEPALACETFPQALQAVRSGAYAALLPTTAAVELSSSKVRELRGAALGDHAIPLLLAHDPRLLRVRPSLAPVIAALRRALSG